MCFFKVKTQVSESATLELTMSDDQKDAHKYPNGYHNERGWKPADFPDQKEQTMVAFQKAIAIVASSLDASFPCPKCDVLSLLYVHGYARIYLSVFSKIT